MWKNMMFNVYDYEWSKRYEPTNSSKHLKTYYESLPIVKRQNYNNDNPNKRAHN